MVSVLATAHRSGSMVTAVALRSARANLARPPDATVDRALEPVSPWASCTIRSAGSGVGGGSARAHL